MGIYPVDSIIHPWNNLCQEYKLCGISFMWQKTEKKCMLSEHAIDYNSATNLIVLGWH